MAEKFKEQAIIIRQEEIADDIYSMWLRTEEIAAHAKAGQFVSVYCNEGSRLLPRPISLCEIDKENGRLRIVYRIAGAGTKEFSAYELSGVTITNAGSHPDDASNLFQHHHFCPSLGISCGVWKNEPV